MYHLCKLCKQKEEQLKSKYAKNRLLTSNFKAAIDIPVTEIQFHKRNINIDTNNGSCMRLRQSIC